MQYQYAYMYSITDMDEREWVWEFNKMQILGPVQIEKKKVDNAYEKHLQTLNFRHSLE